MAYANKWKFGILWQNGVLSLIFFFCFDKEFTFLFTIRSDLCFIRACDKFIRTKWPVGHWEVHGASIERVSSIKFAMIWLHYESSDLLLVQQLWTVCDLEAKLASIQSISRQTGEELPFALAFNDEQMTRFDPDSIRLTLCTSPNEHTFKNEFY